MTNVVDALRSDMLGTYGMDGSSTSSAVEESDKDVFLNLLITQMQYQDPLEPTSNEAFLAQMAQFSSLEQMQNLNQSFTMQQGYDLVGKTIIGKQINGVTQETSYVEGVVESVVLKAGETYLRVDGKDIKMSGIEAVLNSTTTTEDLTTAIEAINQSLLTITEKLDKLTGDDASDEIIDDIASEVETTSTT